MTLHGPSRPGTFHVFLFPSDSPFEGDFMFTLGVKMDSPTASLWKLRASPASSCVCPSGKASEKPVNTFSGEAEGVPPHYLCRVKARTRSRQLVSDLWRRRAQLAAGENPHPSSIAQG